MSGKQDPPSVSRPIHVIPVPDKPLSHIHMDLVGLLPLSHGFSHMLTIIDRHTRWPEMIPMKSTTADSYVQALLLHWVAWFGVPRQWSLQTHLHTPSWMEQVPWVLLSLETSVWPELS